jgi:serine/threonine protein kinase
LKTYGLVGPYKVGEKLGEGGRGVVYCAHDTRLRRNVALKFISGRRQSLTARKRFLRQARGASALNHPRIVASYDIAEDGGETYIVMEYVEGNSLRALISRGGMEPGAVVSQAIQMAGALAAAHKAGIVETQSQLTAANTFVGTAAYLSPEQSLNRTVAHHSDIFSPGVVVQELLTRERPFAGESNLEQILAINHAEPKRLRHSRPELPWSLEALLLRILEKKPEDRIQTMEKVRESLGAIERELQHREIEDHSSTPYWLFFKAGICYPQSRYGEALECARRSVERQPDFLVGLMSLANAPGNVGRYDEAREVTARVMVLSPGANESGYFRFNERVVGRDMIRPPIGGLAAAGIFKGE